MLEAVISMGLIGLLFGGLLAVASRVFAVPRDPRVEEIIEVLPAAQCGACGYPGCAGLAEAIVRGDAAHDACPPGGPTISAEVAKIMGVDAGAAQEREVAVVMCGGAAGKVSGRHLYDGIKECRAAVIPQVAGRLGHTLCQQGCLGFGSCVTVCPFDAIYMGDHGLPIVDREACTGCRKCVDACPRDIIEMRPVSETVHVLCRNTERGAAVRKYCKVGCIACRLCAREVPEGYEIENNLARVAYGKGLDVSAAIAKCPTKTIVDLAAPSEAAGNGASPEGRETA